MSRVVRLDYAYGVCPKCGSRNIRYLIHDDGLMHEPYEAKCLNCNSYLKNVEIHSGEKSRTNVDRVRAMNAEQLAELFNGIETEGRAYGPRGKNQWLDWLKQEDGTDDCF